MASSVENLAIERLRSIRTELASLKEDTRAVKQRLATLEASQGSRRQHLGHQSSAIAQLQLSFDRTGDGVERIERRLELADAP